MKLEWLRGLLRSDVGRRTRHVVAWLPTDRYKSWQGVSASHPGGELQTETGRGDLVYAKVGLRYARFYDFCVPLDTLLNGFC